MSIKRRGGDDKANYFYRFTYKGHDFCEGGFRTSAQATEAERLAKNKAISQNLHPEDYAGEMTMRQACQWWTVKWVPAKRSGAGDIGMLDIIADYFDKRIMRDIRPEEIDAFLSELQDLRNAKQEGKRQYRVGEHTRNHYRALLHAIYERLKIKKMFSGENPVQYVDKISVPVARCRFIYPSEEKILTPEIGKERDLSLYYRMGIGTGMRIGEMRALRVKHVDLTLGHIFVEKPKNDRSRYVPLDGPLMGLAATLLAGKDLDAYLLPHWSYSYLLEHFYAACERLGIKNLHIHDWRHTFAYNMLSQGASLYKVSQLMGHSSTDVTEKHYGHLAAKDLRDAIDGVKPFLSCNRIATADEILKKSD